MYSVVNCFQNCIFTWHSQLFYNSHEFITVVNCFQNCIFTWHSQSSILLMKMISVVNCFQNCIFTWHSQFITRRKIFGDSCELLSELYFYLAFAVRRNCTCHRILLWIAFRIVFLLGIRSPNDTVLLEQAVVNCFQNCIFTWHSQFWLLLIDPMICCELLSELYFYLAFAVGRLVQ